ncbi:MAG: hypothetical protein ABJN35_14200 [Erythrobacter sp.]
MAFKSQFRELGQSYLAAIEGAIGCRIDAEISGKTYELADLTATLRRFYEVWSPDSIGLRTGWLDIGDGPPSYSEGPDLHSASEIEIPLRDKCRHDPGVFVMMTLKDMDRVRSLLMFADAILFWDPFEEAIEADAIIDSGTAQLGLAHLKPLRPLIKAGFVVPAQLARTRQSAETGTVPAGFAPNLMWQAALGSEEFNARVEFISDDEYELTLPKPDGLFASKGWLGHAENKVASLFLPDIVIPLMDFDSMSSYQQFCKSIDKDLKAREMQYVHQSLAFETGFILDPTKLTNEILLELRERDEIFVELRRAIIQAVEHYEDNIENGHSSSYIEEFNIAIGEAFRELKSRALVSNTWKEFVDESRSFSSRFLAKEFSAPIHSKAIFDDVIETAADAAVTSVANIALASLKTYGRYRNTKILMDVSGAIRENHESEKPVSI